MNALTAPEQAPWPDASSLPAEDASALEWARFYPIGSGTCSGWSSLPIMKSHHNSAGRVRQCSQISDSAMRRA